MKYLAKTGWGLYGLRYKLAYIVLFGLLGWLVWLAIDTPGSLTRDEYQSVMVSEAFHIAHLEPSNIVYAPYYILQKLSFLAFGVTTLSIKAPSILLGILTLITCYYLLRLWFNRRVAPLAVALVATNSPFLFYLQSGTPDILYMLVPAVTLLAASLLSHTKHWHLVWKIGLALSVLVSLYIPAAIYALLAVLVAILFHPHVRHVAFHLSKWRLITAGLVFIAGIVPIGTAIYQDSSLLSVLLGVEGAPSTIMGNATQLAQQYVRFDTPIVSPVLQPLYTLPILCIALLGFGKLLTTKYTARSYIIMSWLGLLTILLFIYPQSGALLFIPILLLVGFGLRALIRYWYNLFPLNPYARTTGLLAIILVAGSIVTVGITQYNTLYRYAPMLSHYYSNDLRILETWQRTNNIQSVSLLPRSEDTEFYSAVARMAHSHKITVNDQPGGYQDYIATTAPMAPSSAYRLNTILTDGRTQDAARFYIYKKVAS